MNKGSAIINEGSEFFPGLSKTNLSMSGPAQPSSAQPGPADADAFERLRGGWGELSGKESWHTPPLYEKVCGLGNN